MKSWSICLLALLVSYWIWLVQWEGIEVERKEILITSTSWASIELSRHLASYIISFSTRDSCFHLNSCCFKCCEIHYTLRASDFIQNNFTKSIFHWFYLLISHIIILFQRCLPLAVNLVNVASKLLRKWNICRAFDNVAFTNDCTTGTKLSLPKLIHARKSVCFHWKDNS